MKAQAIRATDKLNELAEALSGLKISSSEKVSDKTEALRNRFLSLASKIPERLMIHADEAEGTFTLAFLDHLTDEQLQNLKEEVELHKDKDVFLYFYTRHSGKREPSIEVRDFENFDFERVLKISMSGNTVPHLQREDLPPIHYVSVTFHVA